MPFLINLSKIYVAKLGFKLMTPESTDRQTALKTCFPSEKELIRRKQIYSIIAGPFSEENLYAGKQTIDWLCWGLTTRQPLWVILCRLPETGRKETEEIVEEMKERTGKKEE